MKKLLFLSIALFGMICWTQVHAQKLNHVTAPQTHAKANVLTAAKLASMDVNIIEKTDSRTGRAIYFRKSASPTTGNVTYTEVEFCSRSKQFVEVPPVEVGKPCSRSNLAKTQQHTLTAKGIPAAYQRSLSVQKAKVVASEDCITSEQEDCEKGQVKTPKKKPIKVQLAKHQ